MQKNIPLINLAEHTSLIYGEGVFGSEARKKLPMRAKTADGILRYALYPIQGIIDSTTRAKTAGEVLGIYVSGCPNERVPIFSSIKEAKERTGADVLILGAAPEGGGLPKEWESDIQEALESGMHVVSGMHYPLKSHDKFQRTATMHKAILWDVRTDVLTDEIALCSAQAYHIKKPIILTVGTDAAIGKMSVSYDLARAAQKRGVKAGIIPTGQTAVMIEGWGFSIDALTADFMAGAVEKMLLEKKDQYDAFFVEGQGSLFHPAFANTCIALLHGAVPTHLVLVHRPTRKHSIGSRLVALPSLREAIQRYEQSVLPPYRGARVIAVALNTAGMQDHEANEAIAAASLETGLPAGDVIKDAEFAEKIVTKIFCEA